MTRRTSPSPRLWAAMVLLAAPWALHGQCLFAIVDAFDDEVPIDLSSLDPDGCATLSVPLLSPNWHNVSVGDQTDWLPHEGGTPTNGTGPFSTNTCTLCAQPEPLGCPRPTLRGGASIRSSPSTIARPFPCPRRPPASRTSSPRRRWTSFRISSRCGPASVACWAAPTWWWKPRVAAKARRSWKATASPWPPMTTSSWPSAITCGRHDGILVFETSLDGGFTWEQHWAQIGAAGSYKEETGT